MRRYETITIIDPDLSEEGRQPVLERVESLIPEHKGLLVETDEWGARKLAYEIKKKVRGYYVRFDYCGTGGLVDEIERFFRIDDRVLKYMTILSEENVDLEKIKETIAAAAEAKKQKKASEAAASKAAASKAAAPEAPPASDSTGSPVPAEAETAATGETASAEDKTEQAVEQNQTDEAATQPQDETTEAAETAESTETAETDPEPAPSAEAAEEKASAEQPAAAETAEPETDTETEKK